MFVKITLALLIIINLMTVNCKAERKLINFILALIANDKENVEVIHPEPNAFKLHFIFKNSEKVAEKWAKHRDVQNIGGYVGLARHLRNFYESKLIGKIHERYGYWIDLNHSTFSDKTKREHEIDMRNKVLDMYFSEQETPKTDSIKEYHPEGNQGSLNSSPEAMAEEEVSTIPVDYNTGYPPYEELNPQALQRSLIDEINGLNSLNYLNYLNYLIDPSILIAPSPVQQTTITP